MRKDDSSSSSEYYSVATPLSLAEPTFEDLAKNEEMEIYMFNTGLVYETEEGERNRILAIQKLRRIAYEWSLELAKLKNITEQFSMEYGGIQLRIFGSTRLGVHNADSDIDILCLAASYITRVDFFSSLYEKISQMSEVHSILSITDAYTPVLKFTIDGQPIDMVFASLEMPLLPHTLDILDLNCLKGLDDQSVRSLNGARVAEWILRLVPNTKTFCSALRVIKHWARQRGLYSNVLGFLGGVNFAILVALVCQLYINACPYVLVQKFFSVFSIWRWPNPVLLRSFEDLQLTYTDGKYLSVWNPKTNYKDALHIMPIITPAYPSMNSSYNVSPPQFRLIQDEILRACSLFQGHNSNSTTFPWSVLFEASTSEFFRKYSRYIQVDICAQSADDQRNWFGWVESRLRLLIISLEQPPLVFCHPVANCFHPMHFSLNAMVSDNKSRIYVENKDTSCTNSSSEVNDVAVEASLDDMNSATSAIIGDSSSVHRRPSEPQNMNNNIINCSYEQVIARHREGVDLNTKLKVSSNPSSVHHSLSHHRDVIDGRSILDLQSHSAVLSLRGDQQQPFSYVSSFFIGLSFQKGLRYADITPAIHDFTHKVMNWPSRKTTMDLRITALDNTAIPSFVFETKAEPSNVKSCTPNPKQQQHFNRSSHSFHSAQRADSHRGSDPVSRGESFDNPSAPHEDGSSDRDYSAISTTLFSSTSYASSSTKAVVDDSKSTKLESVFKTTNGRIVQTSDHEVDEQPGSSYNSNHSSVDDNAIINDDVTLSRTGSSIHEQLTHNSTGSQTDFCTNIVAVNSPPKRHLRELATTNQRNDNSRKK